MLLKEAAKLCTFSLTIIPACDNHFCFCCCDDIEIKGALLNLSLLN